MGWRGVTDWMPGGEVEVQTEAVDTISIESRKKGLLHMEARQGMCMGRGSRKARHVTYFTNYIRPLPPPDFKARLRLSDNKRY